MDRDSECSYSSLDSQSSFADVDDNANDYLNSPMAHHTPANSGMHRHKNIAKKRKQTPRKRGKNGKFGAKGGRNGTRAKQTRKRRNVSMDQRTPIHNKKK